MMKIISLSYAKKDEVKIRKGVEKSRQILQY
jgi:hypothetical protein